MIEKATKTLEQEFREIKREIEMLTYDMALKHLKVFNNNNERFDCNVGFFCLTVFNRNGICHVSNSVEIHVDENDVKQYIFQPENVHPNKLKQGDLFKFLFDDGEYEFVSLAYYQGSVPIVTCCDLKSGQLHAFCCRSGVLKL